MNAQDLQVALRDHGCKYVYNAVLMNEDVHIFPEKGTYHDFKIAVADVLKVSVKNVAIVGSAKMGYSLTPGKNFSAFHTESDLDLVVVSVEHFDSLWRQYYEYVRSSTGASYAAVAKNIFKHFLSIKAESVSSTELEYLEDWITLVGQLKKQLELQFKLSVPINYRVYEDWVYVDNYHLDGLETLRRAV